MNTETTAKIETFHRSSSANWTAVIFNNVPTEEQIQATINPTDGDYNHSGRTITIYHRTISGIQRTENVANSLRRINVRILLVKYHGKILEQFGVDFNERKGYWE